MKLSRRAQLFLRVPTERQNADPGGRPGFLARILDMQVGNVIRTGRRNCSQRAISSTPSGGSFMQGADPSMN